MSIPAHRPRTRKPDSAPSGSAARPSASRSPSRAARACHSPVASIRTTSTPTAQASGLPPKVEPCEPGVNTSITLAVGHDRRHRHDPAAERLAEDPDVGHDVLVVAGEGAAGAAEPRLDLVGEEQHVVLVAQRAHPAQVALGRDDDPASPWIGSSSTATVSSSIAPRARASVAVGHDVEPGVYGPKPLPGVGVGREGDDGGGAAVEVAVGDDDRACAVGDPLDLVAPRGPA
jgi:hypothetical protein